MSVASTPVPSSRPRTKMDVRSAWASWQAGSDGNASGDFLDRVSDWVDGTTAQFLRQKWAAGTARPTASELQQRLHRELEVVARGPAVDHVDALATARRAVIGKLGRG